MLRGFPAGANGKEPPLPMQENKRCRFSDWVRKSPWRRSWQPIPVFFPGESHGHKPGGLQSMVSQRVEHNEWPSTGHSGKEPSSPCRRRKRCGFNPWVREIPWRRKWQPTPVFLPGESHGQRSPAGYSPWDRKELDTTEPTLLVCWLLVHKVFFFVGQLQNQHNNISIKHKFQLQ